MLQHNLQEFQKSQDFEYEDLYSLCQHALSPFTREATPRRLYHLFLLLASLKDEGIACHIVSDSVTLMGDNAKSKTLENLVLQRHFKPLLSPYFDEVTYYCHGGCTTTDIRDKAAELVSER